MSTRRKSLCLDDAMEDGEQKETFRMYRALDLALCLGMGGKRSNVCFESLVQIFSEEKGYKKQSMCPLISNLQLRKESIQSFATGRS